MIQDEIFYTATCDNCGIIWQNHDGIYAYRERGFLIDSIRESEWKIFEDKWCCSDCYFMNDNDEYEIKASLTKQQGG